MADFAANLISVPGIVATSANGGNTDAALILLVPNSIFGPLYGSGQDAVFIEASDIIQGELFMGFSPSMVMAPDTVLSPRAINRVYDAVAGKAVTWVTDGGDSAGVFYPGPGVYGVNTSNYVLVAYICSG